MNALILLAQAFFNHQTQVQTENLKLAGLRAAETGRRMAIGAVFFAIAGAFIFAAILIGTIDLGLQIDREAPVSFSGLMISASMNFALGLFSAFAGWIVSRDSKATPTIAPAPTTAPVSELRPMLEAIAVTLLKEYLEAHKAKTSAAAAAQTSATANSTSSANSTNGANEPS